MPTYTVRSGDFTGTVETPFEAEARIVATLALLSPGGATALGIITVVTGGQFVGDNETFIATERILKGMGRFDGANMARP